MYCNRLLVGASGGKPSKQSQAAVTAVTDCAFQHRSNEPTALPIISQASSRQPASATAKKEECSALCAPNRKASRCGSFAAPDASRRHTARPSAKRRTGNSTKRSAGSSIRASPFRLHTQVRTAYSTGTIRYVFCCCDAVRPL